MAGSEEKWIRGKELTDLQRRALKDPTPLLVCGFIESDGNPVDGEETYRWTRDADNFRMVLDLGEE